MKEKNFENREITEREYVFDAVFIDSGQLTKKGDRFYPTDYRDSDDFGMLGGGMRLVAATDIYFSGKADTFVFMTGVTEKSKSRFGPDVPTEARITSEKFRKSITALEVRRVSEKSPALKEPKIILQEKSFNTLSNIREAILLIRKNGWRKIAFLSSNYHMPRYRALWDMAAEKEPDLKGIGVVFLGAEDTVKETEPGKYDAVIDRYYGTSEAKKRISNENRGVEDIQLGRYAKGEFQLDERSKERNRNEK